MLYNNCLNVGSNIPIDAWFKIEYFVCSHQRQHFTNQLSKDTNKLLKDVRELPPADSSSEQVRMFARILYCNEKFVLLPKAVLLIATEKGHVYCNCLVVQFGMHR